MNIMIKLDFRGMEGTTVHGKKIKIESKDDIVLDDSPAGTTQLKSTWINLDTLMLPRADIIQKVPDYLKFHYIC